MPPLSVVAFSLLAALTLGSAGVVAFSKNIIHSALALLGTFLGIAGLYITLSADFLAATQVLVYVGDNVMDFPGLDQAARDREESLKEFGGRFILIPNPMYGSWEKNERR